MKAQRSIGIFSAAVAMFLLWGHAEAQSINGCYRGGSGQLYLIGIPGAPSGCFLGDRRVTFAGTRSNTFNGIETINGGLAVTGGVAVTAPVPDAPELTATFNMTPRGLEVEAGPGSGNVVTAICLDNSDCWGVYAVGTGTGVYAQGPKAGDFFGDVEIAGTLTKSAGAFKIDHPLDPANKFLTHS